MTMPPVGVQMIEFVGGPLDGELRAVNPDWREYRVPLMTMPTVAEMPDPDATVVTRIGVYRRVAYKTRSGVFVPTFLWDGER